jgi:hypothetical protein
MESQVTTARYVPVNRERSSVFTAAVLDTATDEWTGFITPGGAADAARDLNASTVTRSKFVGWRADTERLDAGNE